MVYRTRRPDVAPPSEPTKSGPIWAAFRFVTLAFTDRVLVELVVMVVMDHVRAGNSWNRDCGKNDESDQVAH